MAGVTPNGIHYPDGASKAKNLGPELEQMAEDIDWYIGSYLNPTGPIKSIIIDVAEDVVPPMVDAILDDFVANAPFVEEEEVAPSTQYAVPFEDENMRVLGGFYQDGTVEFEKQQGTLPHVPSRDQGVLPLVSDNGYIFGRIYDDGSVEFEKLLNSTGSTAAPLDGQTVSSRWEYVCVGDSLTDGVSGGTFWPEQDTWPYLLGQANTRTTVTNLGEGGLTVDEIGINVGALPLVLQADVTVPASGSVAITPQSGIGWRTQGRTVTIPGRLGSIPGTLTRVASNPVVLTFESDGSASGTVATGEAFVSDFDTHKWDLMILGAGRNDIALGVTGQHSNVVAHVTAGLDRLIGWLAPQRKRFLIWGTLNEPDEGIGTSRYADVLAVNSWCATQHPEQWVDARAWLVNEAIYEMGLTPTSADLTAIANDAPPPQLMDDGVHFLPIVAPYLADVFDLALKRRDWKA